MRCICNTYTCDVNSSRSIVRRLFAWKAVNMTLTPVCVVHQMERVCAKRRRLASGLAEDSAAANSSAASLLLPEPPARRVPVPPSSASSASVDLTLTSSRHSHRAAPRPPSRHSRPRRRWVCFISYTNLRFRTFLQCNYNLESQLVTPYHT